MVRTSLTICLIALLFKINAFAQSVELDSITEIASRNIIAFHLRNALDGELGIAGSNFLRRDAHILLDLYPTKMKLNINAKPIQELYSLPGYKFYHLKKHGFRFTNGDEGYSMSFSSFKFDDDYLIAVHEVSHNLKFLSGNFYTDEIASNFSLDPKFPESYFSFLRVKLFKADVSEISFKKRRGNDLIYTCHSKSIGGKLELIVRIKNPDTIKIRFLENSVTY